MKSGRYVILFFSLILVVISQQANAGDKTLSIYTPVTFGTSSIALNSEAEVVRGNNSNGIFGIGANLAYQKNAAFFIEKVAVGDSSKKIYISGIKFNTSDAVISNSKPNGAETALTQGYKGVKLVGDFVKVSYILGASRITQDEMTDSLYSRKTGNNAAFGLEFLAMKSSNLHFVPLRFILTWGQSGTSVFASSEIGFSILGL